MKLRIETVTLASADAGNGAAGNKGGGGGAGVVIKGATVEGAPAVTKGKPGAAGGVSTPGDGGTNALGTAPGGNPGTAGKEGVAQDVLEVQ